MARDLFEMSFSLEAVLVYTFELLVIWIMIFFAFWLQYEKIRLQRELSAAFFIGLFFGLGIYGSSIK